MLGCPVPLHTMTYFIDKEDCRRQSPPPPPCSASSSSERLSDKFLDFVCVCALQNKKLQRELSLGT